jgi:formiminoglutamase
VIEFWRGDAGALTPGRPVLVGFPQDEGVRRNHGRVGAAAGPRDVRHALWRLTPYDSAHEVDLAAVPLLDAGNVRIQGTLEDTQRALGEVIGGILEAGAVPVVLGGGHETAYGHFLGYLVAGQSVGIVNLGAHLGVRPFPDGHGHSGSPVRQALEHPGQPLAGNRYVCLGAQPSAVSRAHVAYLRERGGVVRWAAEIRDELPRHFRAECERLAATGCRVYVTIDASIVDAAEAPGVSAPNVLGLSGAAVAECAYQAGLSPAVSSLDVVEVNPRHDQDGRSTRWVALVVWHFLAGLAARRAP